MGRYVALFLGLLLGAFIGFHVSGTATLAIYYEESGMIVPSESFFYGFWGLITLTVGWVLYRFFRENFKPFEPFLLARLRFPRPT